MSSGFVSAIKTRHALAHALRFVALATAFALAGCTTQIQKLNGFRSSVGFSTLTVSSNLLDFGNVNVHATSAPTTVTFTNELVGGQGAGAVTCGAPVLGDPLDFSIVSADCGSIAQGSSCSITVDAEPAARGVSQTTLAMTCTDSLGTSQLISTLVRVNGVEIVLAVSPMSLDFGTVTVGGNSATSDFTFSNSGNIPATGCSVPTITDTTNFSLVATTCGTNDLVGGGSCIASIRANPTSPGGVATTLSRTCTVGGTVSTTTNLIVATGATTSLAWSPLTHDFGSVNVGTNSAGQAFTLSNTGGAAATGCSAPTITDTTNFSITADGCGTSDLAAVTGTCSVTVRANPGSTGAKATTLSRVCSFGGTVSTTTNQIVVTGAAPALAWTPLTKDFGNVNVGSNSSTQTFTLTNSGTATATGCSAPALSNSTDFTIVTDNCGTNTLAGSGATCTVDVRANPAATGAKSATLSRACTFGGTPTTTANQIVVNGVSASLVWSPLTHDFGNVNVGSNSSTQSFTLTNTGGATATGCSAPALSNSTDFTIVTDNCGTANLAGSNATCTVDVRANPTSSGAKATTLSRSCTFGGSASTTANQIVTSGIAPTLAWTPMTKDFGNVNAGSNSSTQTFTLTNSGTATATGCSAPS
ncbi:MAG: choice-of-anchor D domain-containing protein, partial [Bdellovibrionales bacterium]|nr:choice-of-anchor D domain-containing protein [Bdellovibrionales bacterium]